ncbi:MAG: hypothetical protein AAF387_21770, partial [Pseudomonadota bacterium]
MRNERKSQTEIVKIAKLLALSWLGVVTGHVGAAADGPSSSLEPAANDAAVSLEVTLPPPAAERNLNPHPRLFLNRKTLPALREKLAHELYARDVEELTKKKNATFEAFKFVVWNDRAAGERAKQLLMKGKVSEMSGLEKANRLLQYALLFDWIYPLLSATERQQVISLIKKKYPRVQKPKKDEGVHYYLNDVWGRGGAFASLLALSLAGDDDWADSALALIYKDSKYYFSPYHGGAIDTLNTLALGSGGGLQVGHNASAGTGYESAAWRVRR